MCNDDISNYNSKLVEFSDLGYLTQATGQTRGWIFTRDSSKDVKSSKNVPFRVIKFKFNFKPLFIPQNHQILAQNGTVFLPKMLNNEGTQE